MIAKVRRRAIEFKEKRGCRDREGTRKLEVPTYA
jgi:hypothetical protein